jgi:hypothetical protein
MMFGSTEREAFSRLLSTLRKLAAERGEDDRENARFFSPFEALLPNEIALSRMLKYLLDPSAPHGQGRTFLDQFLMLIGPNEGHFLKANFRRMATEYLTATARKIDIVLWLGRLARRCRE